LAPEGQRRVDLNDPELSNNGFLELSGRHGLGSCSLRENSLVCFVSYPRIDYDLTEHLRNLLERHPADVVERKKGVVGVFAHDPEGIVEIHDLTNVVEN